MGCFSRPDTVASKLIHACSRVTDASIVLAVLRANGTQPAQARSGAPEAASSVADAHAETDDLPDYVVTCM